MIKPNTIMAIFLATLCLASCNEHQIIKEKCSSDENFEMILSSIDTNVLQHKNSFIYFTLKAGCGGHENQVFLNTDSLEITAHMIKGRIGGVQDTTTRTRKISRETSDIIVQSVRSLHCQQYELDQELGCMDCDTYEIFIKEDNILRGWIWDGKNLSIDMAAARCNIRKYYIHEDKAKAQKIEGLLYKASGYGKVELRYFVDGGV